jgi:hypothetical protein
MAFIAIVDARKQPNPGVIPIGDMDTNLGGHPGFAVYETLAEVRERRGAIRLVLRLIGKSECGRLPWLVVDLDKRQVVEVIE